MLQIYAFHGTDFEEVYGKLNRFLGELAIVEVQVGKDDIRANTKYYPDWDRTATTIEVCLDFTSSPAPHEIASQISEMHHAVLISKPEPLESDQILKARALLAQRSEPLVLEYIADEGWRLRSDRTTDLSIIFWGLTSEENILDAVKIHLGIKEEKPASDDFDPFLDSDDLP